MTPACFAKSKLAGYRLDWTLLSLLLMLLFYGLTVFYSASSQNTTLLIRRAVHIFISLISLCLLARIPPRFYEAWAPCFYLTSLLLLLLVLFWGDSAKGAQRWLCIGFVRFQPSELVKLMTPLMMARFFSRSFHPPTSVQGLWGVALFTLPTLLVALQPDLGTAILIAIPGLFILFSAGVSRRFITLLLSLIIFSIPITWHCMHDYQRNRIAILLNPEQDPLGSGYHIMQSKIAIGSGGMWGKGWLQGTQSQLEFLPERHTDFIFSVLAEEFGIVGVCVLLSLYLCIVLRSLFLAIYTQTTFGQLTIGCYGLTFFCYACVNIGMVSGLLPVVGIPLPLISYGGTSLIVTMASFGITMSLHTHRKLLSKSI